MMTKRTYADVLKDAKFLTPDEIKRLIADLGDYVQFFKADSEPENGSKASAATVAPEGTPPGGWEEIKTIKGYDYRYRRWRENGRLKSQYIGRVREQE